MAFRRSILGLGPPRHAVAKTIQPAKLTPAMLRSVSTRSSLTRLCCYAAVGTSAVWLTTQLRYFGSHRGGSQLIVDEMEDEEPSGSRLSADELPAPAKVTKMDVRVLDSANQELQSPETMATFSIMQKRIPDWLFTGIQRMKYEIPTPIQEYTVPQVLAGRDLIGLAPTGSGKTVAFAVPSLAKLQGHGDGYPQILVVCPVRELAQQTAKVFRALVAPHGKLNVVECFGGADRGQQASALWSGADILVATPGRLNDFLESGDTDLRNLSFLVFDEADRLLDMGFAPQLDKIMEHVDAAKKRQTLMWSATWPKEVQTLANKYLQRDRLMVRAGNAGEGLVVNESIAQNVHIVNGHRDRLSKFKSLYTDNLISQNGKVIVFCQRKDACDSLAAEIGQLLSSQGGLDRRQVVPLHGGMNQDKRDRVIELFKTGRVRVIVATDVAARGLDFPDVEAVVNFDSPMEIDSYVHRIGRTGRAGRTGVAHTFVDASGQNGKWLPDLVEYLQRSKQPCSGDLKRLAADAQMRLSAKRFGRGGGFGGGRGRGGNRFGGGGGGGGGRFGGGGGGGGRFGGDRDGGRSLRALDGW